MTMVKCQLHKMLVEDKYCLNVCKEKDKCQFGRHLEKKMAGRKLRDYEEPVYGRKVA